jgi:hypothetical protein
MVFPSSALTILHIYFSSISTLGFNFLPPAILLEKMAIEIAETLHKLDFQVGRKIKNMLSLQIIQVAIEGAIAIMVNRNCFQVQACPGPTAFKYVSSAIKPMRPLDQGNA